VGILGRKKQELSTDKWVVFDFDGTIAETGVAIIDFFNIEIVPHFGCPPLTYDDLDQLRELNIVEKMEYIKIPIIKLPSLIRRSRKKFRHSLTNIGFVDGLDEQFALIQNGGYRLAIISSNRKKNIKDALARHNISVFETIFCDKGRSLFVKHKTIKKFLKTKNIPTSQMVYIGDEGRDVTACKRVNVPVLGISWGWDSHKRLRNVAEESEIVDTPSDLFPRIQEILG